jgi:hypothetical protein
MKQAAHSWIAIRAMALLADNGGNKGLVKLLGPYACEASVGSWLPDATDAKVGGSATDNHIFKMLPLRGRRDPRFVADRKSLVKRLGATRLMSQFLAQDKVLSDDWWARAYKADPKRPGQHLPNRAMAMHTMLKDLLLLGDDSIDKLVGRGRGYDSYLVAEAETRQQAVATYFFMISHFVTDSCMPCHCDGRNLADYGNGLHKEWEAHWDRTVGKGFTKDALMVKGLEPRACIPGEQAMDNARAVDQTFGLDFNHTSVATLGKGRDIWLEMIDVCRASFALSAVVAPPSKYSYGNLDARAPYAHVLSGKPLLGELDKIILHDAVLNTAMVWQDTWQALTPKKP